MRSHAVRSLYIRLYSSESLRDAGMKTQVCMVFHVDSAPVRAWGTCRFIRAGTDTSASEGQRYLCASFMGSFPHGHISCPAGHMGWPDLSKVMPAGAFSEDFARPLISMRGIDIPVFQQFIGREVVMCGVKADILR